MPDNISFLNPNKCDLSSDVALSKLYHPARSCVKKLVHLYGVSPWRGQEYDIVEDHVQEAVIRTWERCLQAVHGEAYPVASPIGMCITIARNYCIDKSRQDCRYLRVTQDKSSSEISSPIIKYYQTDPSEDVIERVYEESLLVMLPSEIVKFPAKQRRALLIDLANRMDFDGPPTVLQLAFLNVGIQMQDYQIPLPIDPVELSRHRSLLSLAYKRLKDLACVKQYCSVA